MQKLEKIVNEINALPLKEKVIALNEARELLHQISPFKEEPVDFVRWVPCDDVAANDYNPNSVAPPEMELLRHSINHDGYTQPVVTWVDKNQREVIDGFHRTRVCKELPDVRSRVNGYLPVVTVKAENQERNDRIASTIRHNRARGKHNVAAMSDIVLELKNRNWKDARIAKELGMDQDEVLRLCQISGLEGMFKDADFSKSWEIGSASDEYKMLTDEFELVEEEKPRTVNTGDPNRKFHTYEKWECYKAGFHENTKAGMTAEECKAAYAKFLSDIPLFESILEKVTSEWKYSCEQQLTNTAMNRIAWLGQACLAYHLAIPSKFCSGFNYLTEQQQCDANEAALKWLNKWLVNNDLDVVSMDDALSVGRQASIY
jgi:ParB-like chromosome segregation protein Spo0J